MTMKIAVSLPDEQVAMARRAVKAHRATSVSAYIAESIARREREDSLVSLLDDLDRELGEPDSADYAWADKALGLA
jgi:Arc/MetJ-type ribon-helix-helix transcriptional regulator